MFTEFIMTFQFIPDSCQKKHDNTIFTFSLCWNVNSAMNYSSISIFLKCPLRKALNSHCYIVSEADPIVEDDFGPFVGFKDEIDNDIALVCFKDQKISVYYVSCFCHHVFQTETVLEIAITVVGSRSWQSVTVEGKCDRVLYNIR